MNVRTPRDSSSQLLCEEVVSKSDERGRIRDGRLTREGSRTPVNDNAGEQAERRFFNALLSMELYLCSETIAFLSRRASPKALGKSPRLLFSHISSARQERLVLVIYLSLSIVSPPISADTAEQC